MLQQVRRFEVIYHGHRYWASLRIGPGFWRWNFWSDHRWPFYHGSLKQTDYDPGEAWQQFTEWLPFKYQVPRSEKAEK